MTLADDLICVPLRERSATGDRYEYQALWGLALLFKEHGLSEDYAIIFEFHDDIALLDHSVSPTRVRFYQIKSKDTSGGWTLSALLHRQKISTKKGITIAPSYLDKMYDNIHKFSNFVLSVDFVSNQLCGFKADKKSFRFSECASDHFKKIVSSIQEPYPVATVSQIGLLGFEHTDLSLGDTASHTKGKLQTFIATHLGHIYFSPEAAYQAIIDECRRKANFKGDHLTLSQVIEDKGITKKNVQEWLSAIQSNSRSPEWGDIVPSLNYAFSEMLSIRNEYNIYRAAALDISDRAINRIRMSIINEIPEIIEDTKLSLGDMVDNLYNKCYDVAYKYLTPFKSAKLKAMIIYEIYTYEPTSKIQTTHQELETEKL